MYIYIYIHIHIHMHIHMHIHVHVHIYIYIIIYLWAGMVYTTPKNGDIQRVRLARRETVEIVEPGGTLCGEPQWISVDLLSRSWEKSKAAEAPRIECQHVSNTLW